MGAYPEHYSNLLCSYKIINYFKIRSSDISQSIHSQPDRGLNYTEVIPSFPLAWSNPLEMNTICLSNVCSWEVTIPVMSSTLAHKMYTHLY